MLDPPPPPQIATLDDATVTPIVYATLFPRSSGTHGPEEGQGSGE